MDGYETLRAAVLVGQASAKDIGTIVFHGLWQGLTVLSALHEYAPRQRRPEPPPTAAGHDRQLVHLLANLVLAAETRGHHVY